MSFIASGEDSGAWRYPKNDRSRGFVWPLVEIPLNSTATDSVKIIIALFYQWQYSRLLEELSKFLDYSVDDSGVKSEGGNGVRLVPWEQWGQQNNKPFLVMILGSTSTTTNTVFGERLRTFMAFNKAIKFLMVCLE